MKTRNPNPTGSVRYRQSAPRRPRGVTLVELMIALGLGLLLMAAVGAVYLGSTQTYRAAQDGARIQESGRYALDVVGRSVRQAGYVSVQPSRGLSIAGFTGSPVRGLDTTCPTAAPVSDMITVQYQGSVGEQDCQGENIVAGDIVQHSFFIQDATLRCDAVRGTAPTPPTACLATDAGAPLLDNVEDLQVLYGVDTGLDQSADLYTATPGDWAQVVSARVCLLVRSENQGSAPRGQTYLNCAGALGTAASDDTRYTAATDTRLRRAFVATFTLRNRVP